MKTDRLLAIIMLLQNTDRIHASALAEMLEVAPRTIYRDVEAISQAGIPIVTYPGLHGGIGLMPEYKVKGTHFTAADFSALLSGLEGISLALPSPQFWGTLEKIRAMLPTSQKEEITMKSGQVTIDPSPWMGSRNFRPRLELIRKGMDECRILSFHYVNSTGQSGLRRIEPYRLVMKEGVWYLQGYCLDRKDARVFKLTRMSEEHLEATPFAPRSFYPKDLDGTGWQSNIIQVQLRIEASLRDRLVDLCSKDCLVPTEDGRYLVEFPFPEDDYGYSLLLGFGENCECLSPASIRSELARRIRRMLDKYEFVKEQADS